ncbi:MAG: sugar ABC transporter permease, partial [Cellulomonadaceae bacterium]|nr:sugar ABC transporter permease [Cellulomonadaceae bacterium]
MTDATWATPAPVAQGEGVAPSPRSPRPRHRQAATHHLLPYLLMAPAILAVTALVIYPIGQVFVQSFFDIRPTRHQGWIFTGLDNYVRAFADAEVRGTIVRTLVWTLSGVGLQFVVGLASALILKQFVHAKFLRAVFILPWATPMVVGALAWRFVYQNQGLVNSLLGAIGLGSLQEAWLSNPNTALGAVIVANVWRGFPFIMVMLIAGMASIPDEVYEASAVDGAGYWRQLRSITLPMLRPSIMASTLMGLIWTFNSFANIWVMTNGGPAGRTEILTTFVYRAGFARFDFGHASALSILLFCFVAVGSSIYLRAF